MKYFWSLLLCCLLLTACQDNSADNNNSNNNSSTTTADNGTAADAAADRAPKHISASALAPFIGLWSYSMPVSNDVARTKDYEGRWIEFSGDQTFKSGKWQEQTNTGTFEYDENTNILLIRYKNQKDATMDWKIKLGIDVMIWLGNANINTSGDQIRMQKIPELPENPH
ncbi:MAG: hypothetical protein AAGG75_06330 [Bacteroidota bacterium]